MTTTPTTPTARVLPDDLIAAWHARTAPLPGGHLAWTGARDSRGVPVLTRRQSRCTAARLGFVIANGCEPVGQVKAGCGLPGCVEPTHLDDFPRRQRTHAALRTVLGTRPRPARCRRAGHDQSVYGRLRADGRASCGACHTHTTTATPGARNNEP